MNLIPIQTLEDPRVSDYANMRDAELAQRRDPLDAAAHGGLFIAEGELVVERLVRSRFPTRSVLLTENRLNSMRASLAELPAMTPIYSATQSVLNAIVGFIMHRGVLAIGTRTEPWTVSQLAERSGPLVVLEDLANHDNLGGIFRNAAALGGPGSGVLLSPRCADPLYRKSLRVSMGHILSVPFARAASWPDDLHRLRDRGWLVAGLTPSAGAIDLESAAQDWSGRRVALVVGTEGTGLSAAALQSCDHSLRIRMRMSPNGEVIDSLNAAMAAGIALHRLGRD